MAVLELLHGDCRTVMAGLLAASVDAVVCDPPYGLSFMGKDWDHGVPGVAFWSAALRVAKPGAHLLAFGGTRTFHRLAVAIEDAGWEIRDTVMWLYGSGFPKSLNVAAAIGKLAEPKAEPKAEETEFCGWLRENATREHVCLTLGKRFWDCEIQIVNTATKESPILGRRALVPTSTRWQLFKSGYSGAIPDRIEELAKPAPVYAETPGEEWTPGKGNGTAGSGDWAGWGTALKPAWEPIIVARKPLEGTVAANVLAHGTGALNIDGCRVGTETIPPQRQGKDIRGGNWSGAGKKSDYVSQGSHGRWPANLIHDGSDEVLAGFPQTTSGKHSEKEKDRKALGMFAGGVATDENWYGDTGSAARFFYCAKASKADRDEGCEGLEAQFKKANGSHNGRIDTDELSARWQRLARNHHPTVKPTALMRYLCKLVTPPAGTVLDPFMGSGSTGKAARMDGFGFIGIEQDADYIAIARARIAHAVQSPAQQSLHI